MKVIETPIAGLYEIDLDPKKDSRGFLVRAYCLNELASLVKGKSVVQINHTLTVEMGSIRGMHFQLPPFCETKFIRCIRGSVFDVAVDLREGSASFLKWYGVELTAENMKMLVIPEGFAHGFQTLEDNCELLYLHTEFYNTEYEAGIRFDDSLIGIDWKIPVSNMSDKDKNHKLIDQYFKGVKI